MSPAAPVTVAFLHHLTGVSGGERSLLQTWERLDRHRFRPVLVAPGGPFADAAGDVDVACYAAEFPRLRELLTATGWGKVMRIRHLIERAGARLVHGNAPASNTAAVLAGRADGRRLVWHQRTLPRPDDRDFESRVPWLADRVICNSQAVAERFGCRDHNVVVVHNGVDTERFKPGNGGDDVRGELGLTDDEVAIGIVGNFSPLKNHELFLQAAYRVARRHPRARFLVVGGEVFDDNRGRTAHIERCIGKLGLHRVTHMLGHREDMPAIMDALDVLVAAASVEACSRAAVEAMAAGVAVVAADAGGNPELVDAPSTGLLVRPECAIALADALEALVLDAPLRRTMATRARRRAVEHFRIEDQVQSIENVYTTLLEER